MLTTSTSRSVEIFCGKNDNTMSTVPRLNLNKIGGCSDMYNGDREIAHALLALLGRHLRCLGHP
jgi:hypothetical protein